MNVALSPHSGPTSRLSPESRSESRKERNCSFRPNADSHGPTEHWASSQQTTQTRRLGSRSIPQLETSVYSQDATAQVQPTIYVPEEETADSGVAADSLHGNCCLETSASHTSFESASGQAQGSPISTKIHTGHEAHDSNGKPGMLTTASFGDQLAQNSMEAGADFACLDSGNDSLASRSTRSSASLAFPAVSEHSLVWIDNLEVDTAVPDDAEDFPDLGTSPGRAFNDFGWRKLTTMHPAPGKDGDDDSKPGSDDCPIPAFRRVKLSQHLQRGQGLSLNSEQARAKPVLQTEAAASPVSSKHRRNLHGLLTQPWKAFGGESKPAVKLPNKSKNEDASPRRPARPVPTPAREPSMDVGTARASHVSSATKHFEALNTWTSDDLGSHTPHSPSSVAPKEPPKKKKPFQKAQKFLSSLIRGKQDKAHNGETSLKRGLSDVSGGATGRVKAFVADFDQRASASCQPTSRLHHPKKAFLKASEQPPDMPPLKPPAPVSPSAVPNSPAKHRLGHHKPAEDFSWTSHIRMSSNNPPSRAQDLTSDHQPPSPCSPGSTPTDHLQTGHPEDALFTWAFDGSTDCNMLPEAVPCSPGPRAHVDLPGIPDVHPFAKVVWNSNRWSAQLDESSEGSPEGPSQQLGSSSSLRSEEARRQATRRAVKRLARSQAYLPGGPAAGEAQLPLEPIPMQSSLKTRVSFSAVQAPETPAAEEARLKQSSPASFKTRSSSGWSEVMQSPCQTPDLPSTFQAPPPARQSVPYEALAHEAMMKQKAGLRKTPMLQKQSDQPVAAQGAGPKSAVSRSVKQLTRFFDIT